MRIQVNQESLKVNGTNHLLVCADDLNILGRSMHTIKEKTEALVVACKEIGQDINVRRLSTWSSLKVRIQGKITA
jgi:hypothetical protein